MAANNSREKSGKPPTEEQLLADVGEWVAKLDDKEVLESLLAPKKYALSHL